MHDEKELVDFEDDSTIDPDEILSLHRLPARGLEHMESTGRLFHVVNAGISSGDQLAEAFGNETTLLVDGGNYDQDNLNSQIKILNQGGKSCRVVFSNLGEMHWKYAAEIEDLIERYQPDTVKSFWFVHDKDEQIPTPIMRKVLLQCRLADAATLLDAVAFGWGAKNPYDGKPVMPDDVIASGN